MRFISHSSAPAPTRPGEGLPWDSKGFDRYGLFDLTDACDLVKLSRSNVVDEAAYSAREPEQRGRRESLQRVTQILLEVAEAVELEAVSGRAELRPERILVEVKQRAAGVAHDRKGAGPADVL